MTKYTGRLSKEQRATIDALLANGRSVRKAASDAEEIYQTGITYGQVRYYVEQTQEPVVQCKPPAGKPKILVFDIETAPYLTYNWTLWKANAIDIHTEWYMLSFAYGWYDIEEQTLGPIEFVSLEQDTERTAPDDDGYVAARLWELFDEAEIVVGQNHERFDIKKGNERMFVHGMTPYSPFSTLDTKRIWNKNFSGSAALKYTARKADVALKSENIGFPLWLGCMGNQRWAWEDMEKYNRADVEATAGVFTRLIPWIDHPTSQTVNFGHWRTGRVTCKKCMNFAEVDDVTSQFVYRGTHKTNASVFQTLECKKCGGFTRWWQRNAQRRPEDKVFLR